MCEWAPVLCTVLCCRDQPDMAVRWNSLDGSVDRRSHTGKYEVVDGLPR